MSETTRKFYRDESRDEWYVDQVGELSDDQLKLGAILRIADAVEEMAIRHTELIDDNTRYKADIQDWVLINRRKDRQIASLRGQVTKLKRQLEEAKGVSQ